MAQGSDPGPSRRGKSDADLLREHGIDQECRVVLSSDDIVFAEEEEDDEEEQKVFKVHYGRHFLWQIAVLSYRHPMTSVDLDNLYSTYITSPFSSLDREQFKSILLSYFKLWEDDFTRRRHLLVEAKLEELRARRRAERDARRRCKITYRNTSVIVPILLSEEAKTAMRGEGRLRVLLERLPVDEPEPVPGGAGNRPEVGDAAAANFGAGNQAGEASIQDRLPGNSRPDEASLPMESHSNAAYEDSNDLQFSPWSLMDEEESPCLLSLDDETVEVRDSAVSELITDIIVKVCDQQNHEPDMSSTDCYSDDTVESPMEVEFASGESPDYSKVLRDSEETCHGDEFYEVARANKQSGEEACSSVVQRSIAKSQDKAVVKSVKR